MTPGTKLAAAAAVALAMASGTHQAQHGGGLHLMDVTTPAGGWTPQSWARAFLRAEGDPRTPADVGSVVQWEGREGGAFANSAKGNPLNTTLAEPGSWAINSVDVQAYPSWRAGLRATAATLASGPYGDVTAALASGRGLCGRSFTGLHNWSAGPAGPAGAGYWSVC